MSSHILKIDDGSTPQIVVEENLQLDNQCQFFPTTSSNEDIFEQNSSVEQKQNMVKFNLSKLSKYRNLRLDDEPSTDNKENYLNIIVDECPNLPSDDEQFHKVPK